jgi:hypothetical protein
MSHTEPNDLMDATRDWTGPLVGTEVPPVVPGMQPAGEPIETFPTTWPPAIKE